MARVCISKGCLPPSEMQTSWPCSSLVVNLLPSLTPGSWAPGWACFSLFHIWDFSRLKVAGIMRQKTVGISECGGQKSGATSSTCTPDDFCSIAGPGRQDVKNNSQGSQVATSCRTPIPSATISRPHCRGRRGQPGDSRCVALHRRSKIIGFLSRHCLGLQLLGPRTPGQG